MRSRQAPPFVLSLLCAALGSRPALAALTDSEKAVVRTFVDKAVPDTAGRVRALVARPDSSADEAGAALQPGLAESPFDDRHRRFIEALLFGPGSTASRNTLAPAVVQGLLARAASQMSDVPLEATAKIEPKARAEAEEIVAIHAFVDARIANAGTPPPGGHDPATGIRDDADRACAILYKEHIAAHERWLKVSGRASEELLRIRTQLELTLADLARGVATRQEVGEWLGLGGTRRAAFERDGLIVEADDLGHEAAIASAVERLESAPHAEDGLSAWLLSKVDPLGLSGQGRIERAGVALGEGKRPLPADALWPVEVKPSTPDATTAAVAWSVAELAVSRSIAADPALAGSARRAALHAARLGAPAFLATDIAKLPLGARAGSAATPLLLVSGAVRLLLVDGPRAVDLALIRAAGGRPEALEQLAVALDVLAGGGPSVTLGQTQDDGAVVPVALTAVKSEGGVVTSFVLAGKTYVLTPDPDGTFSATVDGAAPKLTSLASFRVLTEPGDTWTATGIKYDRLHGHPSAAGLDDGRFVLQGSEDGFDAVTTGEVAADEDVSAVILPSGAGGSVLLRATAGDTSYAGIGLMLGAGKAQLVLFDGHGKAVELSPAAKLPVPPGEGYPVTLKLAGDRVSARVGGVALSGKLLHDLPEGRAGFAVLAKGRLDLRRVQVVTKAAK